MPVPSPTETQIALDRSARRDLRRRLDGHAARSRTTIHGWGAALFGSVFVAAGVFVVLAALDVIPTDDADFHAPRALVAFIGAVFFALPGASLVVHGLVGVARDRRLARARVVDPPWRWDHAWWPQGDRNTGLGPFARRALAFVVFSAFLAPFHWLGAEEGWPWMLIVVVGLFDVILLLVAGDAVLRLARALRYGSSRLAYDRFPFHPGEAIGLRFSLDRPREFGSLRCTLRCVEEAYETHGSGRNRSERVVSYVVWESSHRFGREESSWCFGRELAFVFFVPKDAPGTALSERPPRYWELHVRGETIGPDLDEVFLVPIYARQE